MKYLSYLFFLVLTVSMVSCDGDQVSDDEQMSTPLVYSVAIMSPDASDKKVGDDVHLHVNFDEAEMGTIHHVNVEIVEKGNEANVLYSGPSEAHVHEESGHHEHHDDITLAGDDVMGDTEWIMRAKVWGHEAGLAETVEEISFKLGHATPPEYSIMIMSPDASDKKVGDDIHIHVNFDEADMGTIHHAKVIIFEKGNETNIIYEGPAEAHVHDDTGHYELHADVKLEGTGIAGDSDWVLQAKVWGHEAGLAEVIETREFHLDPQ